MRRARWIIKPCALAGDGVVTSPKPVGYVGASGGDDRVMTGDGRGTVGTDRAMTGDARGLVGTDRVSTDHEKASADGVVGDRGELASTSSATSTSSAILTNSATSTSSATSTRPVRPAIYHCVSRVVNREWVLGELEREKQRTIMRMIENFSGCRVLAYCFMSNHFHLLLEVAPMPAGGLTDAELLTRLRAIYNEDQVAGVADELQMARRQLVEGTGQGESNGEVNGDANIESNGNEINREWAMAVVSAIHARFTYRMHDLSEFMKGFVQRYTQWHNKVHQRTGRLWEDRFKSVIVEDGAASRTIAAYIDLNPVRAGLVKDPADYRWSSYGEAVGGGGKGLGYKARAGLVRALRAHQGVAANAELWAHDVSRQYRKMLLAGAVEKVESRVGRSGEMETKRIRKGMTAEAVAREQAKLEKQLEEIPYARMLRCRVRYFTDGAVLGSRAFVNDAFAAARWRFGARRKDGARKMRGAGAPGAAVIWSMRDLRLRV